MHVFILWIFYTAQACSMHSTSVPWFECCILYVVCYSLKKENIRKNIFKGKKMWSPKRKMCKQAFPFVVSGATDGVVKNVPAGQSSAPITLMPTADSFNLKYWGLCTMELHLVNLLSLTLIRCVNHDNRQLCSQQAKGVDCSALARKQR